MVVGVLRVELHLPLAESLKDKRSVLKSLKDQLHGRFNVAVAELEPNEKWQRAALGIAAVGSDRSHVERCMHEAMEAIRRNPLIAVIRCDEEYL